MGNKKDKNDNNNNVIRFPKEIEKECPICGMSISALPADMQQVMSVHYQIAHGEDW